MTETVYLDMVEEVNVLNNLHAMEKLRHLPRSLDVANRISAIRSLLSENEVYATIRLIRAHLECPACGSTKIERIAPKAAQLQDGRWYYECQACKEHFDDATGTPFGEDGANSLYQWITCWYLIAFCPLSKIGMLLGLSLAEISKFADFSKELPNNAAELKERLAQRSALKTRKEQARNKEKIQDDEITLRERRDFGLSAAETRRFVIKNRR